MPGFAALRRGISVLNPVQNNNGGPPGTRTRDHRIKSQTDGLSTTTTAKRVQQSPTGNPHSFNTLTDVCLAAEY